MNNFAATTTVHNHSKLQANGHNIQRHTLANVSEYSHNPADIVKKKVSPLHLLAINGGKQLLQQHVHTRRWDVNEVDHMGRTPLIYSVLGDQVDCVMLLLKEGANIDDTDVDERTALHWAAYQGSHKLVKLLLSKGANQIKRDKEGKTPLHFSTSHNNIKVMQFLIKTMKETQIDTADYKKMTALCWSVFYDRIDYVRLLLRNGASTSSLDKEGRTALHWASENKDALILNMLLEDNNDNLNWQDGEGRTALHMCVGQSNKCLVENLLKQKGIDVNIQDNMKRTPLHWAAVLGNTELVSLLIDNGSNFNIGDNNGVRPLQYASQNNFVETVKLMVEKKGVKDVPDNDNGTALMWAAAKGCNEVLHILLVNKCSVVNSMDIHKQTALHMSTQAGHLKCVQLLIAHGADVNLADGKRHIPLFYACASGNTGIVTELLNHSSAKGLEERDLEGRCPLHYAAMVDRTDVIKILMQSQPNTNIKDNAGCPPLHFAAYGGFVHCMRVLSDNKADVDIQDNDGRTALHWACRSGSLEAVKLLVSGFHAKVNVMESSGNRLTALDYAYLEDHEDVVFYLTENNAYTARAIVILKEYSAIKIQAAWRGFSTRHQQKLLRAKFNNEDLIARPQKVSTASTNSQKRSKPTLKEYKIYSDSIEQEEKALQNLRMAMQSSSNLSDLKEQTTDLPRNRSVSNLSAYSVSPKSSVFESTSDKYLRPDYRQGPKFFATDHNPLSLKKGSSGSVVSLNKSFEMRKSPQPVYHSHSTKSDYWNGSVHQQSYSSLSNSGKDFSSRYSDICNGNDAKRRKSFGKSSASDISVKNISTKNKKKNSLLKKPVANTESMNRVENNNFVNKSYSRHVPDLEISHVSSSSSTVFQTKNVKPVNSFVEMSDSSVVSSALTNTTVPRSSISLLFNQNTDVNKPWNKYKRNQQRVVIIRRKTQAAMKIQRCFRSFIRRKKHVTRGDATNTSSAEEVDLDELEEVAALVIQLAWRQYMKRMLLNTVSFNSSMSSFESSSEEKKSCNNTDSDRELKEDNLRLKPPLTKSTAKETVPKKKKVTQMSSCPILDNNEYNIGMRKKRSKRFSLKKRLLNMPQAKQLGSESPYSASVGSVLTKDQIEAVKNSKTKLLVRGKSVHT